MAFNWFKKKKGPPDPARTMVDPEDRTAADPAIDVDDEEGETSVVEPQVPVDPLPDPTPPPEPQADGQPPDEDDPHLEETQPQKKGPGLFARLKSGLSKTRKILTTDIDDLFLGKRLVDDDMIE
ncbi:MAG: hypothetical protein WBY88_11745, partial [Desulfosarcina sp.]